jgi:hypothetical protein
LEEIIVLDSTKTICYHKWFSWYSMILAQMLMLDFCWNKEHEVTSQFFIAHSYMFSRLCTPFLANFVSSVQNIKMIKLFEEPSYIIILINLKV